MMYGGMGCPTPGMRIRSRGLGRGLARGRGRGPIGNPIGARMDLVAGPFAGVSREQLVFGRGFRRGRLGGGRFRVQGR